MRNGSEMKSDIASAILLEKIIRDTYVRKSSGEFQPLQWSILRYLERAPELHRTITWIARFLAITHAPVIRAVNTLHKRGLVAQKDNPDDARSKILSLTEEGLESLKSDPILGVVQRMQTLPERERLQLRKTIRALAMNPENGVTRQ